ncbi:hypothetical protein E4T56_gene11584, partial [Termitomyces sp. T112]
MGRSQGRPISRSAAATGTARPPAFPRPAPESPPPSSRHTIAHHQIIARQERFAAKIGGIGETRAACGQRVIAALAQGHAQPADQGLIERAVQHQKTARAAGDRHADARIRPLDPAQAAPQQQVEIERGGDMDQIAVRIMGQKRGLMAVERGREGAFPPAKFGAAGGAGARDRVAGHIGLARFQLRDKALHLLTDRADGAAIERLMLQRFPIDKAHDHPRAIETARLKV